MSNPQYAVLQDGVLMGIIDDPTYIDTSTYQVQLIPTDYWDEAYRYDAGVDDYILDYAILNKHYKTVVDNTREANQVLTITEGYGKAQEYVHKANEIQLYDLMDPVQFSGLTGTELQEFFTFAYEDAAILGGTVAEAIERFREGARTSKYAIAKLAAQAQYAKTQVVSAVNKADKDSVLEQYGTVTGGIPQAGLGSGSELYITLDTYDFLENEAGIPLLV